MRVVIFNVTVSVKAGGVETFCIEAANHLAHQGVQVVVFGGRGDVAPPLEEGVVLKRFAFTPRARIRGVGSRLKKFFERASFFTCAARALWREPCDWVYVHKSFDVPLVWMLARLKGVRVAFSSHGTEFFPGYGFFVRRVDALFACSHYNAHEVHAASGRLSEVLYNGVDTARFAPQAGDAAIRRAWGLEEGVFVAFSACRLVGWKGLQTAIEALAGVREPWVYLIAGEGEYRVQLAQLAQGLGVGERVRFVGRVANRDLPRYYSVADVALYPSVGVETFGISIAEAMATGTLTLASRVGGIPEVLGEESEALLSPRDVAAWRGALVRALHDPLWRGTLGCTQRERVLEHFGWDRVAAQLKARFAAPLSP